MGVVGVQLLNSASGRVLPVVNESPVHNSTSRETIEAHVITMQMISVM